MSKTKKVILLVEDDLFLRRDLSEAIQDDGAYEVVAVDNGSQAIEWLAKNPKPAVMVSDFLMPVPIRGDELAKIASGAGITTIIVTGCHDEAILALKRLNMTRVPVVSKPFCVFKLLDVIDTYTGRKEKLQEMAM